MFKRLNLYLLAVGVTAFGVFCLTPQGKAQSQVANLQEDFKAFSGEVGQARVTGAAFLDTNTDLGGRTSAIAGEVLFGSGIVIDILAGPDTFATGFTNLDGSEIGDNTVISNLTLGSGRVFNVFPVTDSRITNLESAIIGEINSASFNAVQANALVSLFQNNRSPEQARVTGAGFLDTSEQNGGRVSATAGEIELAQGQSFVGNINNNGAFSAEVGLAFQGTVSGPDFALNEVNLDIATGEVSEANPLEAAVTSVVNNQTFSTVQVNALVNAFVGGDSSENFALD
mgnify:CR=1 FL=1